MSESLTAPNAGATTESPAQNITTKQGYAARWQFSVRKVDDLIALGLPHLKVGQRRVRILIPEADKWMAEQFGTQRRKAA